MANLPKLTVVKATYGKNSNTDVTAKVQALLTANGGNLIIDARADFNQLFGDPEPGQPKLFHMVYSYGPYGAQKSITHAEKHVDIYLPALEIRAGQVLTVNVLKAVGLRDTRTLGKQDPYAVLKSGSETFKTKVHEKGATNPEWNQSFIFNLDGKDQFMHVTVYDKGTISDDVIGRFDIPLPTLAAAVGEVAYGLVHPNDFKKSAGSIVLRCEFKDPNAPNLPAAAAAPAAAPAQVVPVMAAQPQVVYMPPQQPQVVYQQPQVVYQQPQVVYQQPQVVYQQPVATAAAPAVVYQPPVQVVVQQKQPEPVAVAPVVSAMASMSVSNRPQNGGKYFIRNVGLGKYLSMNTDSEPRVYLSVNQQAWEQWTVQDAGSGQIVIKNATHGKNVSLWPDKVIGSPNTAGWEQFTLKQASDGKSWVLSSANGNLGGDGGEGVRPTPNSAQWEWWSFEQIGGGSGGLVPGQKYVIRNQGLGKNLSMDTGEEPRIYLSPNSDAWEWWSVSEAGNGKHLIKNWTHGKHVSAWPDKFIGSPNTAEWEQLQLKPVGDGSYLIYTHHGQYLGGRGDDSVGPTGNTAGWEQWVFQAC